MSAPPTTARAARLVRAVAYGLLAAAAAIAGGYAYYRASQPAAPAPVAMPTAPPASTKTPVTPTSASGASGFRFSLHDEPRPLPRIAFTDGDWRDLTLEAFRGKVVLLNIWVAWCVPCREEMPTLNRLQATLGGEDFQVVALSIDQEGIFAVKDFYEELGLEALDVYVDDTMRAPALLAVVGVPATLLIDREGREIARKLGPAEWDSKEIIEQIRRHIEATRP